MTNEQSNKLIVWWNFDSLTLVMCQDQPSGIEVVAQAVIPTPENNKVTSVGEWNVNLTAAPEIHQAAQAGQIDELTVFLPRQRVTSRHLQIPAVIATDELSSIVQMQYSAQAAGNSEQTLIDYLPLQQEDQWEVLAAGIPQLFSRSIYALAEVCRVALHEVRIHPLLTAVTNALAKEQADLHDYVLICCCEDQLELAAVQSGMVIEWQSRKVASFESAVIAQEFKRFSLRLGDAVTASDSVVLVSCEDLASHQKLSEALQPSDCRIVSITGKVLSEEEQNQEQSKQLGQFLAEVGGYKADPRTSLDFANPRKDVPKKDRRPQVLALAGATAALLIIGGVFAWFSNYWAAEKRVADLQELIQSSQSLLKKEKPRQEKQQLLAEHLQGRLVMSNHLKGVVEALPATEKMLLTRYKVLPGNGRYVARIQATAITEGRPQAEALKAKLDQQGLVVRPTSSGKESGNSKYPYQFELDLQVE